MTDYRAYLDTVTDRRQSYSMKWDVKENELPMWVADMDFRTAPEITEALEKRVRHGIFGYTDVPKAWYDAYVGWWKKRHHLTIERESLLFCTGVIPAISSIVRKLTTPAEKVLLLTPVYNIFYNSVLNNGRNVLECPLSFDGKEYTVDFADLERKLSDPQTTLMILCNPHNPIGKIWDKETLERIGELCYKHHVVVISDEIHCDLTAVGKEYVPFSSVSEVCRDNSITCIAPTKTFNLAGLQTAAVMIPDKTLRHKVWRAINTDEAAEPNCFAVEAAVAAYTHGEAWLDALREYIDENRKTVGEFLKKELPALSLISSEATYLLWIDCRTFGLPSDTLCAFIREKTGLYLSSGAHYGTGGDGFLRMNIACPRALLLDGLSRLKKGFSLLSDKN